MGFITVFIQPNYIKEERAAIVVQRPGKDENGRPIRTIHRWVRIDGPCEVLQYPEKNENGKRVEVIFDEDVPWESDEPWQP